MIDGKQENVQTRYEKLRGPNNERGGERYSLHC